MQPARRRRGWRRLPLEVAHGLVDFLAGLLNGALADHLVLIGDLVDLLSRALVPT
jgi:hypothetical protein